MGRALKVPGHRVLGNNRWAVVCGWRSSSGRIYLGLWNLDDQYAWVGLSRRTPRCIDDYDVDSFFDDGGMGRAILDTPGGAVAHWKGYSAQTLTHEQLDRLAAVEYGLYKRPGF